METSLGGGEAEAAGRRPYARAVRKRQQPTGEAGEEVHARESRPLLVRLEELGRLGRLDPPPLESRDELDQAEVADEPALGPAESLQADDADRPWSDPALAQEPAGGAVGPSGV